MRIHRLAHLSQKSLTKGGGLDVLALGCPIGVRLLEETFP